MTWILKSMDDANILSPSIRQRVAEIANRINSDRENSRKELSQSRLAVLNGKVVFAGSNRKEKMEAARQLAAQVGCELYLIDLATIIGRSIAEMEKNLDSYFAKGERSGAVLFFDEAEALFGKRTEVKGSHDRHANQSVSVLLQKIENYSGVVILSLKDLSLKNKDELNKQLLSRVHSTIEFFTCIDCDDE